MKFALTCLSLLLASVSDAGGFDVTGQILGVNRADFGWILLAGDDRPNNFNVDGRALPVCRSGDIVRARGCMRTDPNGKAYAFATNVSVVGRAPLPESREIASFQIDDPALYHSCVRIRGIVSSVQHDDTNRAWNQITLRTPTGRICAVVQDACHPLAELRRLIDAEVSLAGYVTRFGAFLTFLGNELLLFEKDGITVLSPASADPFSSPGLTTSRVHRRQRVSGAVVGNDRHGIYLRTEETDLVSVLPVDGTRRPPVGARITVAGFAERGLLPLQIADAYVRIEAPGAVPAEEAVPVNPETDFFNPDSAGATVNAQLCGRIVRFAGTVINSADNIRKSGYLHLGCGSRTADIDISQLGDQPEAERLAGCRVEVSGLCLPSFEREAGAFWIPRFNGLRIIPRTERDIRVLARPPWWTPFRLLCVIGALLVVLGAILAWNVALRTVSERRGRRLARETVGRIRSDLKVEERTRLAVELHDSISQTLTGVALQVDSAVRANGAGNAAVDRYLGLARQMLASCRKELQGCLWDLRGRTFEEKDLNEAILRAIGPQAGAARLVVRFGVPREALSETTLHAILRIARELVVNAVRHGQATEIRIAGELKDGILRFSIRDNGRGFDPDRAPGPSLGHFGLRGIRERLAAFDGTLETESAPGRGAKFTVAFQVRDEREP